MKRPARSFVPVLPFVAIVAATASPAASDSLDLPAIPDFRVPSGAEVDTVFPTATGGSFPYTYKLSGLPEGLSFAAATLQVRGTLPTVLVGTTWNLTYGVSDGTGATASRTFLVHVTAPPVPDDEGVKTGVAVSGPQHYVLRLPLETKIAVEVTGMTADFDCLVGRESCTNQTGEADDSWVDTLEAGDHEIIVWPWSGEEPGPGNYVLTVRAARVLTTLVGSNLSGLTWRPERPVNTTGTPRVVVSHMGGETQPTICQSDEDGNADPETCEPVTFKDVVNVVDSFPHPPVGTGPGEGTPGPGPPYDPGEETGDPGNGGGVDPANAMIPACYATSLVDSSLETANPLPKGRALGSDYDGRNDEPNRKGHNGIDVRAARGDNVKTPTGGVVTRLLRDQGTNRKDPVTGKFERRYRSNGNFVAIEDSLGREHVFLHLHTVPADLRVGDRVAAQQVIGTANNTGNSEGDHLHYTIWLTTEREVALDAEKLLSACE